MEVRFFAEDVSGIEYLGDAREMAWRRWGGDVAEWGVGARLGGGTGWVGWRADAGGKADVGCEEGSSGGGGDAL